MLSSSRPFRWLAALLAILLFSSGTLVAIHLHKDTRDCSLCMVAHSPAAMPSAVVAHVPELVAALEPSAGPIARTLDSTQTHVIRPPPPVA